MIYDVVDEQIDTTTKAFLGLDRRLRPMPRPQVRSHPDKGLLRTGVDLRQHHHLPQSGPARFDLLHALHAAGSDAYDRYQAHRWRTLAKQLEMEHALSEEAQRETAVLRSKLEGSPHRRVERAVQTRCRRTRRQQPTTSSMPI